VIDVTGFEDYVREQKKWPEGYTFRLFTSAAAMLLLSNAALLDCVIIWTVFDFV